MKLVEVQISNALLDSIKLKEFDLEDLKKLLYLKKELKSKVEETNNLKIEIMKKYEIPLVSGGYEYKGHPKQQEIDELMNKINDEEVILKAETNFLAWDKLKSSLNDDSNASTALILSELLVKK